MTTSEWIQHDGKGMPVGAQEMVEITCRDGWMSKRPTWAEELTDAAEETGGMWVHGGYGTDIISYRVVPPSKAISAAEEAERDE